MASQPRPDPVLARRAHAPDARPGAAHLAAIPTVVYEDGFYLAPASQLLARVRKVEAKVRHIMIVGHDPGMHGLAIELAGSGAPEPMQALAAKFPTAGLAVLDFDLDDWSKVEPGSGQLRLFMAPKRLGESMPPLPVLTGRGSR